MESMLLHVLMRVMDEIVVVKGIFGKSLDCTHVLASTYGDLAFLRLIYIGFYILLKTQGDLCPAVESMTRSKPRGKLGSIGAVLMLEHTRQTIA